MREIKFSILLQHEETGRIVNRVFSYADIFNGTAKDEISKLKRYAVIAKRQFTGLSDKQGKDIYEGDILHIIGNHVNYSTHNAVVEWSDKELGWSTSSGLKMTHYFDVPSELEVIGTIHENPELLKDK